MSESVKKQKRISLFILIILSTYNKVHLPPQILAKHLNDFIYSYYEGKEETFALLFDIDVITFCKISGTEMISPEVIIGLLMPYNSIDEYVKLVDEVGYEAGQKIDVLVRLFTEYYNPILQLQNASPYEYYPKGFSRILQ